MRYLRPQTLTLGRGPTQKSVKKAAAARGVYPCPSTDLCQGTVRACTRQTVARSRRPGRHATRLRGRGSPGPVCGQLRVMFAWASPRRTRRAPGMPATGSVLLAEKSVRNVGDVLETGPPTLRLPRMPVSRQQGLGLARTHVTARQLAAAGPHRGASIRTCC